MLSFISGGTQAGIVRIAEGDELGLWVRVDLDPHSRHVMPSESFDATLWRQTGSAV
jgi:hypothetical protein